MKISSSQVALRATHQTVATESRQERLLTWVGEGPTNADVGPGRPGRPDVATLSDADSAPSRTTPPESPASGKDGVETDRRVLDLILLVRTLGGDAKAAQRAADGVRDIRDSYTAPPALKLPAPAAPTTSAPTPARAGWGLEYDLHVERHVTESTQFAANGVVATADGRSITIAARMDMQSTAVQRTDVSVRAGDARKVDPLALNFGAAPPQFDGRQSFDLDANGAADDIARLAGDSAYLAVDRNHDGQINDGRELFGPTSGDGFSELAAGDADGNGWIDENDPLFDQLRLWRPGSEVDQPGTLTTLRQANVGAIYLGAAATPFGLTSGARTVAEVAKTGVFLTESGEVGTVQHIDLLA